MEKTISPEQPNLSPRLAEIVGPENVVTDKQGTVPYEVDGISPSVVVFAATTEQVSNIVWEGNQSRMSIVPWGSGTKQQIGSCLSKADIILCLKPMNKVVELDASNFTVQVEAGIVNGELQRQLYEQNLFFPLDPLFMETSTIGGELAANASGPLRAEYGTVRDIVLGATVVTPTGDILHTGGKTMKNVAGIDLCKLMIGSWGTLGIITEAVLRIYPQPQVTRYLHCYFSSFEDAFRLVAQLLHSPLSPGSVELIDGVAGRRLESTPGPPLSEDEVLLIVNIRGNLEEVERQLKEIKSLAEENKVHHTIIIEAKKAASTWKAYRNVHNLLLSDSPSTIQGKASVPLSKLADMFRAVKETGDKYRLAIGLMAHCYNGILYPYISDAESAAMNIIGDLQEAAARLGGYFTVEAAPLWVRKNVNALSQRNDLILMKQIKAALDPNNILNPGKVFGG
jgi:glycolate oxidase